MTHRADWRLRATGAGEKRPGARLLFRGDLEGALRLVGEKVKNASSPGALPHALTGIEDRPQEVVLPGSRRPAPQRRLS
jgi:hypothetical protein